MERKNKTRISKRSVTEETNEFSQLSKRVMPMMTTRNESRAMRGLLLTDRPEKETIKLRERVRDKLNYRTRSKTMTRSAKMSDGLID
jgi:hypothetical protein